MPRIAALKKSKNGRRRCDSCPFGIQGSFPLRVTAEGTRIAAVAADPKYPVNAALGAIRRCRIRRKSKLRPESRYVRLVYVGGLNHRQGLSRPVDRRRRF